MSRDGSDHHGADSGVSSVLRWQTVEIENPSKLPDPSKIDEIREPIIQHDHHAAGIRRAGDDTGNQKAGSNAICSTQAGKSF